MLKTEVEIKSAVASLRFAQSACRGADMQNASIAYDRMAKILEWVLGQDDSFTNVLVGCKELENKAKEVADRLKKHQSN